jgi:hypothetical protein
MIMKNLIASIFATAFFFTSMMAQTASTPKYSAAFESAMKMSIAQLDTASSGGSFMSLANNFERIGNAEKNQWQPFYYAAYCYVVMAYLSPDKTKIDFLADKAEALLQQADAIDKNNSEISCMFAMINSCRVLVDPMSRFPTKGVEAQMQLEKAKQQNADNPRIYLLQARMQLRIPEGLGGGKKVAKESAELAMQKFNNFKPENSIAPNWGAQQAKSLLDKINAE